MWLNGSRVNLSPEVAGSQPGEGEFLCKKGKVVMRFRI